MIAQRVRFLVFRGGAIGDFIVTFPVLSALREQWPDAYIELIGYPHIAHLALEGGLVDRVDSLDRAGVARFFSLRPSFPPAQVAHIRSFDVVLSFLHDPTGVVRDNLALAGAKQVIYGSPIVDQGRHAVDHLLRPLEALAIYKSGVAPQLKLDVAQRDRGRHLLRERGISQQPYLMHPGSGSKRKNWPIDRFLSLAERIRTERNGTPVFLLGEADGEAAAALTEQEVVRDISLVQAATLMSACRAYVGNDSGTTHLAAAVGIPVVALFGPTSPAEWGPRGTNVTIVTARDGGLESISTDEVIARLP